MSFTSKFELKRQLQQLGIKVQGNYVRKKDVTQILAQQAKFVAVATPSGNTNHKETVMLLKANNEDAAKKEAKERAINQNLVGFDLFIGELHFVSTL